MPRSATEVDGVLEVGRTRIPYRLRESSRAKSKRIVVEPGSVEVVVPAGEPTEEAHAFVKSKRRWVFDQSNKLSGYSERDRSYLSGTKVRFRGRWLTLEIRAGGANHAGVDYQSRFYVTLPQGVAKTERARVAKELLDEWMRDRLLADTRRLAERFAANAGVELAGVALVPMKRMWASCGKDRVVRINPMMIELPRAILEYVVAHEVAHLRHRNHSPEFWRAVGGLVPDWRERQAWLSRYERDWEC